METVEFAWEVNKKGWENEEMEFFVIKETVGYFCKGHFVPYPWPTESLQIQFKLVGNGMIDKRNGKKGWQNEDLEFFVSSKIIGYFVKFLFVLIVLRVFLSRSIFFRSN